MPRDSAAVPLALLLAAAGCGASSFGSSPAAGARSAEEAPPSPIAAPAALEAAPEAGPFARARAAIEAGDGARAREACRRIPEGSVPHAHLAFLYARALALSGETDAALAAARAAADDTRLAVARRGASLAISLLLADGRGREARREILARGSGAPADTLLLAEADLLLGDSMLAAADLTWALSGTLPRGGTHDVARARAVRRLVALESRRLVPPIPPEKFPSLARVATTGGEAGAAADLWKRARGAARSPGALRHAALHEARALARGDRFEEALAAYRALPPGREGADEAAYQIAVNLERIGRDREADRAYASFLARFVRTDLRADALWRRALLTERLRGPSEGVKALRELLRRAPRSAWADDAAWRIGTILFQEKKTDEAVAVFREVARKHPGSDFAPGMNYWIARGHEIGARPDRAAAERGYLEVIHEGRDAYYRLRAVEGLRRVAPPSGRPAGAAERLAREAESEAARGETAYAIRVLRHARIHAASPREAARLLARSRELVARAPGWSEVVRAERGFEDPRMLVELFAPRAGGPVDHSAAARSGAGRRDAASRRARAEAAERTRARLEAAVRLAAAGAWEEAAEEVATLSSDSAAIPARLLLSSLYARAGKPLLSIREAAAAVRSCEPALTPAEMPPFVARLLYPRHYEAEIDRAAARERLDPRLVRSIIREESRFEHAILSHAGAQGLMQLIPPTAERVARDLGIPAPVLADPATNLALGTRYFVQMRERFGGRDVLAMCAYNAGPANAARWVRANAAAASDTAPLSVPEDLFIERISFRETREYVKRILGTRAAYEEIDAFE